jgi:hypothetical protein
LIAELEPADHVGLCQKRIGELLQLICALPRNDFPEVFESSHATDAAIRWPKTMLQFCPGF